MMTYSLTEDDMRRAFGLDLEESEPTNIAQQKNEQEELMRLALGVDLNNLPKPKRIEVVLPEEVFVDPVEAERERKRQQRLAAPPKVKKLAPHIFLKYSVRKKGGGPVFAFEFKSYSISSFQAKMDAEKEIRKQGLDVWALLDEEKRGG